MEADIRQQAYNAAHELCEIAGLKKGQIMVIGCSTSEVVGSRIGTNSDVDVALELFLGIKKALDEKGVYLAAVLNPRPPACPMAFLHPQT